MTELVLFSLGRLDWRCVAAIAMLMSDNAVHSALFLIVTMGCIAFLFLLLNAPFLAMIQITVYTGAIMVLFLFVIMLLGAEQLHISEMSRRGARFAGTRLLAVALVVVAAADRRHCVRAGRSSICAADAGAPPQVRVLNAAPDAGAVMSTPTIS